VIYDELARFGFLLLIVAMTVSDLGRWMATWSFEASRTLFRVFA
jgi:hypothetical protein